MVRTMALDGKGSVSFPLLRPLLSYLFKVDGERFIESIVRLCRLLVLANKLLTILPDEVPG
jgi:ABC-type uncharacterized transport system permease subunit